MNKPSKARIRRSFERAAVSYDSAAAIQRAICQQLASTLPPDLQPARVLDAGCGTGYAQALLQERYPDAEQFALDFALAMLEQISAPCRRLAGDLEQLPLAAASLDLYWSSLAVQWCTLPAVLGEARRVLRAAGHLALASLGPQTFRELRLAFSGVDEHQHTLSFHAPEEIRRLALAAGWAAVNVENSHKIAYYNDFKSLLKGVKAVGANQLGSGRRTSLMSRATFDRAATAYEALRTADGLPLTYDLIILSAKK